MHSLVEGLKKFRPTTRFGKFSAVVVTGYLLLKFFGLFFAPPGALVVLWDSLLFIVIIRYFFRGLRWVSQRLLWRLRRRLIITYLLVGVVPVILLFSIMLILGFAFFGQLAGHLVSNEID